MSFGLCRFTNAVGGTADFEYPGPTSDMQSPASAGAVNGAVYKYYAQSFDMSEWEIGTGAYDAGTETFARTSVQANSNEDTAKIDFSNPPQVIIFDQFLNQADADARYVQGSRGHIPGEASNDPAAAGEIGERVTNSGSTAGNFTSGAPKLIASLDIPSAGDWDVGAITRFSGSGATSTSDWISLLTTVATPTISNPGSFGLGGIAERAPPGLDYVQVQSHIPQQLLTTGPTTVYMHGQVTITGGTVYTASSVIIARRAR